LRAARLAVHVTGQAVELIGDFSEARVDVSHAAIMLLDTALMRFQMDLMV
jgi:hypothetical protein